MDYVIEKIISLNEIKKTVFFVWYVLQSYWQMRAAVL